MTTTDEVGPEGLSWRRLIGLFAQHRGQVVIVAALVVVTSLLGVVNPLLIHVSAQRSGLLGSRPA
jgi:hypothetical protein